MPKQMPERNIELLEQTMQYILDYPEKHDQRIWVQGVQEDDSCGTTACFAGWACFLAGLKQEAVSTDEDYFRFHGQRTHASDIAPKLLGLTTREADILFEATNSVEELQHMVKKLVNGEHIK